MPTADGFNGAFSPSVPWEAFSIRIPEATLMDSNFNLTARLIAIASNSTYLQALQRSLQAHAADVLYESPGSRLADHFLDSAQLAMSRVCDRSLSSNSAPGVTFDRSVGLGE